MDARAISRRNGARADVDALDSGRTSLGDRFNDNLEVVRKFLSIETGLAEVDSKIAILIINSECNRLCTCCFCLDF